MNKDNYKKLKNKVIIGKHRELQQTNPKIINNKKK